MPQQPKPTHLLTARKPVHEDGGRDHDAPVVTAEKVVIARQKARALTVMSGMLREKRGGNGASTASSRPRSNHPHAEVRQSCLPRLSRKSSHLDNLEGH